MRILGLPQDADAGGIRKVWHKLAHLHHPDRGGDLDEFLKYKRAYEVAHSAASKIKCKTCGDTGKVEVTNGFRTRKRRCMDCQA